MTRGMQYFNCYFTYRKSFPVLCYMHGKFCYGIWPIHDRGTGNIAKINMTAYKISMEMGFKNVLDLCLAFIGKMKVFIYVTKRINNCCFAITFNIVSSFAKTTGIQLFYIHYLKFGAKIIEIKEAMKVNENINTNPSVNQVIRL